MVNNILSLTRNGLLDWFIQRVTAVILAVYFLFLLIYLLAHPQLQFSDWQTLFVNGYMRIFSFLALLSLVFHSWVGVWTIFTDYIKCACLRSTLTVIIILALLACLAWGIEILWGV